MSDLKFAFRQLLKNPGFTSVARLALALESYFVRTVRIQKVGDCFSFSSCCVATANRQSNAFCAPRLHNEAAGEGRSSTFESHTQRLLCSTLA